MRNIYFYIILPLMVSAIIFVCFQKLVWGEEKLSSYIWHFDKPISIKFGHQVGHKTLGLYVETNDAIRVKLGESFVGRYLVINTSDETFELEVDQLAYPRSFRTYVRVLDSNIPTQLSLEPGTQVELFVYGYVDPSLVEQTDRKKIPVVDQMYYKLQMFTKEEKQERAEMQKRYNEAEIKSQNDSQGWNHAPL